MQKRIATAALGRWLLSSLLASASFTVLQGAADAGSVTDSVRAALQTNPEIGVVKADRRAVDQELRLARSGYLPAVDLRAAVGPEYSENSTTRARITGGGNTTLFRSEAQLRLSQMLFDGFATDSEVARQRARVDSAAYRVHEAAEFVALNAIEAHLDILRNQEIVALNERNVDQHERILGQVRDLEESGRGDIADVRQAEARYSRAQENQVIARGNLADAIATYQRIVGERPADLEADAPPVAAIPPSPEDAASIASVNSPTVHIAASDVDVAAAELRASRSGFYPRFDVELGTFAGDNLDGTKGNNIDASALLVMRYNIFRGGGDMALEREAFHRANEARANLQRARRSSEEEARLSFNAYQTARGRTATLERQAEAQRRTRDAYASQFEIGQRDLLDVLDAENELFLDRVSLVTAQLTEEFAVYRVLAVVGELLNTLDVARPRENVSIERAVDEVQTPEAIERKSTPLFDLRSEPEPLRTPEEGQPPLEQRDSAPDTGRPGGGSGDQANAGVAGQSVASYDSFGSFWQNVTGDRPEASTVADAPTAVTETPVVATAEPAPAVVEPQVRSLVSDVSGPPAPAEYESLEGFFASVTGKQPAAGEASEIVVTPHGGSGTRGRQGHTGRPGGYRY